MERSTGSKHAEHQADYRQRRKNGLQPMTKPWDWLTLADVQKLAVEAYRSVTYAASDPEDQATYPHEDFVSQLGEAFRVLIAGQAQSLGISCAPANAMHYAACLREDVPANWQPQYPVYKKLTPASASNTPEAVTNADEGNVNDNNFKP